MPVRWVCGSAGTTGKPRSPAGTTGKPSSLASDHGQQGQRDLSSHGSEGRARLLRIAGDAEKDAAERSEGDEEEEEASKPRRGRGGASGGGVEAK